MYLEYTRVSQFNADCTVTNLQACVRMLVFVGGGYSLSYIACVGATDYSTGIQTAELQTLCVNQFDMGRHKFLLPSVGYRRQSLEFALRYKWD